MEIVGFGVNAGLPRISQLPDLGAVELELFYFVEVGSGAVKELAPAFAAEEQTVYLRWPERPLKLAVRSEDQNSSRGIGGHVDVAGSVDCHATMGRADRLIAGLGGEVVWNELKPGRARGEPEERKREEQGTKGKESTESKGLHWFISARIMRPLASRARTWLTARLDRLSEAERDRSWPVGQAVRSGSA